MKYVKRTVRVEKKGKERFFLVDLCFAPIETTRSCRSLISSAGFGESTCQQICSSPPQSRDRVGGRASMRPCGREG